MRIISGRAGGIRLVSVSGSGVRPTEDRVKESIFSTLGDLSGKVVLDLFAGTGALGLEALSRGASAVHGYELDRGHCVSIRENIRLVERSLGVSGGYVLHCGDASHASSEAVLRGRVDVILADPPYETAPGAYGWESLVRDSGLGRLLAPGGLLVVEHGSGKVLPWGSETGWRCLRTKVFGIRAVSYAVRMTEEVHDAEA